MANLGPESNWRQSFEDIAPHINDAFFESEDIRPLMDILQRIEYDGSRPDLDGTFIPNANKWKEFQNPGSDLPLNGCEWR